MLNEKLKNYEATVVAKSLWGLVLKKGEKGRLYEICIEYGFSIKYPDLFSDDTHYNLWGIRDNSIGLIGTVIMNYIEENKGVIFYSLDELEAYLRRG